MKHNKLKIWFEFKREFTNRGYTEDGVCLLWGVAKMFIDEESLSNIYANHSLARVQNVTNWLESMGYLPEKYYTPLNIS